MAEKPRADDDHRVMLKVSFEIANAMSEVARSIREKNLPSCAGAVIFATVILGLSIIAAASEVAEAIQTRAAACACEQTTNGGE